MQIPTVIKPRLAGWVLQFRLAFHRLPWMTNLLMPVMGAVLVLSVSLLPYGIGLSADSTDYIAGAVNLRGGHGYTTPLVPWDSERTLMPITLWPPGYSLALAGLLFLIPHYATAAAFLNLLLFAASTGLTTWIVHRQTNHRLATLIAGGAMVLSPAMIHVHSHAWSEPLFILLVLIGLVGQERFLQTQQSRFWLGAALAGSAATLTRYIGVSALLAGALVILWTSRGSGRRRIAIVGGYSLLAGLPVLLWLGRNQLLTGTQTGARRPADPGTLTQIVPDFLQGLVGWFVPVPRQTESLLSWLLFGVVLGAGIFLLYRRRSLAPPLFHTPQSIVLAPYLAFIASYALALLGSAAVTATDAIDNRLLSPLFPPLIIVLVRALTVKHPDHARHSTAYITRGAILIVALALTLFPAINMIRDVVHFTLVPQGRYFSAARWRNSQILYAVQRGQDPFSATTPIYANAPFPFLLYDDRAVRHLPRSYERTRTADLVADFYQAVAARSGVVVFLDGYTKRLQLSEADLQASGWFRLVGQFQDGRVYAPIIPPARTAPKP